MSLVAALALSLALAAPEALPWSRASLKPRTPTALLQRIEVEHARHASDPPLPPSPPPRFAPQWQASALESCNICKLPRAVDPNDPLYADMLLRLAAHFDAKREYFVTNIAALDRDIADADRRGQKTRAEQLGRQRARSQEQATDASAQASKLLKVLVNSPQLKGRRLDEGLYLYMLELNRLGRELEREETYQRLLKEFPQSPYRQHAEIAAGHHALARGRLTEARAHFEAVLAGPVPELHANALFALAWSHLQSDGTPPRPDLAIPLFIRAIEATRAGKTADDPLTLRHAAQDGLVRAFASAGKLEQALALFQRLGDSPPAPPQPLTATVPPPERRGPTMLEALARTFYIEGQYLRSAEIYRALLKSYPDERELCTWQTGLLLATLGAGDRDAQVRELLRLGEVWQQFRDGNYKQADKRSCRSDAHDALSELATRWHDDYDDTGDPASHARATQTYAAYLQRFPQTDESHLLRIYAAELQWSHAARQYRDPRTRDAARQAFVAVHDAFAAILAREPDAPEAAQLAHAAMQAMRNALDHREDRPVLRACKTDWRGQCP